MKKVDQMGKNMFHDVVQIPGRGQHLQEPGIRLPSSHPEPAVRGRILSLADGDLCGNYKSAKRVKGGLRGRAIGFFAWRDPIVRTGRDERAVGLDAAA